MAWRRSKIAVERLKSKEKGQTNVKHVLRDFRYAVEGTEVEVVVKFSSHRYRATIIDILEWQPP